MHTHNANPANGRVCSHLLTDEVLMSLGIVTRLTDKIMGTCVTTREGLSETATCAAKAVHPMIRTCTVDPSEVVRHPVVHPSPEWVAEALAFPRRA